MQSSTAHGNVASAARGIQEAIARGEIFRVHAFELACARAAIDHRLTKPNHPSRMFIMSDKRSFRTNGQVERMDRTLKDATVKRYHYDSHDQLEQRLQTFLAAYNYAKRLKTLNGLMPTEYICKCWTETPDRFRFNLLHHTPGLNS